MEHDLSMEDNLNRRQPQWKMTLHVLYSIIIKNETTLEDDIHLLYMVKGTLSQNNKTFFSDFVAIKDWKVV